MVVTNVLNKMLNPANLFLKWRQNRSEPLQYADQAYMIKAPNVQYKKSIHSAYADLHAHNLDRKLNSNL